MEDLNSDGNDPEERDWLIILVMTGTRVEAHSLSREVGMGSRSHCLLWHERRSLCTSDSEAGVKWERSAGGADGGVD